MKFFEFGPKSKLSRKFDLDKNVSKFSKKSKFFENFD